MRPDPDPPRSAPTDIDRVAEALACRQLGVVGRFQIVGGSSDEATIGARLRTGRWREVAPGVYSFPGHADTWLRALWTSYLHAGPAAVVSHQSAGRLRRLPGIARTISLIVERNHRHVRTGSRGARWHRLDDLSEGDVVVEQGMRITSVPRTIVDLATVVGRQPLLHATEDAVVRRLTSITEIGAVLERIRRKGKPGVLKMCSTSSATASPSPPRRSTVR